MPSPFIGMDPYLEDPAGWPEVHQRLITTLSTELNRLLPVNYLARMGERVYVAQSARSVYPDAMVLKRPAPAPPKPRGAGRTAVLPASDPPWILTVRPAEIREVFVEIFLMSGPHRLITVIEALSPANKASGSEGRRLYLTKQREILASQTHLMEIDLPRQGEHTVAPPIDSLLQEGHWDYLVSLHCGGQKDRFEVRPISLRERLPRIHVPLADSDQDVVVDLQAIHDRCCDEGAYARALEYERDPPMPCCTSMDCALEEG